MHLFEIKMVIHVELMNTLILVMYMKDGRWNPIVQGDMRQLHQFDWGGIYSYSMSKGYIDYFVNRYFNYIVEKFMKYKINIRV